MKYSAENEHVLSEPDARKISCASSVVLFYYFAKNIVGHFGPKAPVAAPGQTPLLTKYSPAKPSGTLVDMWAYFSESGDALDLEAANLVWHETGIALGSIPELSTTITYKPTPVHHSPACITSSFPCSVTRTPVRLIFHRDQGRHSMSFISHRLLIARPIPALLLTPAPSCMPHNLLLLHKPFNDVRSGYIRLIALHKRHRDSGGRWSYHR